MNAKPEVLLSASIPIPGREPFDRDVQTKRIRDAVLALVTVCKDLDLTLVFGGHPAITPLVHHAAGTLGIIENIVIYQSEAYRAQLPPVAWKFPWLRWTELKADYVSSTSAMRDVMINNKNHQYSHAIFIGGMEGIFDEARRFQLAFPNRPLIPLRSTGGAAGLLVEQIGAEPGFRWLIPPGEEKATSMLRYRRLLHDCLAAA